MNALWITKNSLNVQETEHRSSKDTAAEKYRILRQLSYGYTLAFPSSSFLSLSFSFESPRVSRFICRARALVLKREKRS